MVVAVLTQILHIRVDQGSKHDLVLNILSIMRYEKYSFWSATFWLLMWFRLIKFKWAIFLSDIWLRTILIVRMETRCRHKGYSFRLTTRVFYMHHPTDRIVHTTAFVTPVVEHWLEREIAHEGSIRRLIAPWANALTTELHLAARF